MPHIETSAKNNNKVEDAFMTAVKRLVEPFPSLKLGT